MKDKVEGLIMDAVKSALADGELVSPFAQAISGADVETPKEEKNGDYSSTVALSLARHEKKPPREVAATILRHIDAPEGVFEKVEIAGPGFINFFLKPTVWLDTVKDIERQGNSFGHSHAGHGKLLQVEFVSANPTGPLHIGHGRGAAVGDSLCRLLAFAGFDVRREFYINDYGSQVENLGASVYMRYRQLITGDMGPEIVPNAAPEETDAGGHDTSNLYQGEYVSDVAREFMDDPGFMALPEEEKKAFCKVEGVKLMLRQLQETLSRFGVGFDLWFSERSLYGLDKNLVMDCVAELREKGLVYESDGALWLATTRFGDDKDRVLVRSNGQTTYFASDIAYHRDKYARGFEGIIDVWGADHHGYIPRMKAAVEALGHDPAGFNVLLVQLVNLLREGQPFKMSKRSGNYVTLDEVIDEVGTDACRFTFLLRRSDSHLDFDLDLVKRQSSENPVYYVQYAHARICSVFRQAEEKGVKLPAIEDVDLTRLSLPEELSLIKKLASFPELVEGAALSYEPHRFTYYLQELAGELHVYYFRNRIITEDTGLTHARMYLVKSVRTVIATALRLLGVNAPESM